MGITEVRSFLLLCWAALISSIPVYVDSTTYASACRSFQDAFHQREGTSRAYVDIGMFCSGPHVVLEEQGC